MSAGSSWVTFLRRTGAPATAGLVAVLAVSYVLSWMTHSPFFSISLAFFGPNTPFQSLTYPFASSGLGQAFIYLVLELWWLWSIGGDVERGMGPLRYISFFFALTIIGALAITVGEVFLKVSIPVSGPLIPICAITVAWAGRNPNGMVNLYGVLPIAGKWIGYLSAGIVLFAMGDGAPILGVFALVPLGIALQVAHDRIPFFPYTGVLASRAKPTKREEAKTREYFESVRKREKERQEQERLRKLFESSLDDDSKDNR